MIQDPKQGQRFDVEDLSIKVKLMKTRGMETLSFLGGEPTIHLFHLFQLIRELPKGLKRNLHSYFYFTSETLELLRGVIDLFVAEVRYGNNQCAARYSQAPHYTEVVRRNLLELKDSGLTIRHLLLPGHLECCYLPLVEWVSENLPRARFSIGNEYTPCYKVDQYPEINRRVNKLDFRQAIYIAQQQELNLVYRYVPPFNPTLN
jgi:putative pyruvate formate lyase activating enzyme